MEKILCVDNNLSILELYKEEFSVDGYEVILATDEKQALMKYQRERPRLVIMAMRLPGADGIEVLNVFLVRIVRP